jgi:acetyl esterase/lipase
MALKNWCFSLVVCILFSPLLAQEIVHLPVHSAPGDVKYDAKESEYYNEEWQTEVVADVSSPSMEVFRPAPGTSNGTSVVICPGGGMYLLSINSEGNDVAKWLAKRGVTAFVLKYRLVPTGDRGVADFTENPNLAMKKAKNMLNYGRLDALEAINHIRNNADKYHVDPSRIGLMGFSAGGAVTMEATFSCKGDNCPNFIGPVYAWTTVMDPYEVANDAPPMFVVCASDDPLFLAPGSVQLYSEWLKKGKIAELHMYSKGGHGFGMKKQNLPSDSWIERFGDWMKMQGLLERKDQDSE